MENGEGMKMWKDRRDFNFPNLCLVRGGNPRSFLPLAKPLVFYLVNELYLLTFFICL